MFRAVTAFLLAALPTASTTRASNLDVSLATAQSFQCGETCYNNLQTTNAADLAVVGSDFDWDFYAVADNFSTSKPGDLLKLKPVNPDILTTISGVSVYRIQYVSEDLNGTYVPVSGYIALPFSLPESGEFPLVAFAHGTIGEFRGCAISNGPNLFDYSSWSLLSERGYALVGTDYAGLGTHRRTRPGHQNLDMVKLMASQLLSSSSNIHESSGASLLPVIDLAIKRVFPAYTSSFLGDVMKARMGLAEKAQLCASGMLGLTLDLDVRNLTSMSTTGPTAEDLHIAEQFQNTTAPANGVAAHRPILVVQGVNDTAILAETTEQAYESACSDGSEVYLTLYPKQDHSGVLTAAAPDWLNWMADRFSGKPTTGKCAKQTKQAFDYEYVRAAPEVDLKTKTLN
ncbi:Shikimate O-hydroxycinnamoyltransferase [Phytophthora nicotianae]|uniref:Shikimate O-hydroxycinnamoyltransferase n=1 Tax=Phytophthora nicotianae TaxID=4792 RepID=A0A0W8CAU9_PHYNI|nr:Shikimate O-hydroxycinnamoyltransferase [Phytophthora nicotianae]